LKLPIQKEILTWLDIFAGKLFVFLTRPELNTGLKNLGYLSEFLVDIVARDIK